MTRHDTSIAFLGPVGTNTHLAARIFAEKLNIAEPDYVECSSFDDVFECVDRGRCAYGVVAMENSLEGPVTAVLDNFAFSSSACIVGEEILDIHHCLVAHPDATIDDINTVASHAQGIAQCRAYLRDHLHGKTVVTTSSTAESARLAMQDAHVAGIANEFAAEVFGAAVLDREIGDRFGNQTLFALIARQGTPAVFEGPVVKTSLALFLQADKAGALLMILSEFAYAGINLTKIQSRPTKQALGDYLFFIDIEGSIDDPNVQTALNCLRLKLREVKILGSYPKAQS